MLIEYALSPKVRSTANANYNEDLCGHLGNTFWLLDGAPTSKRLLNGGSVPDGQWLVHRLDAALRKVLIKTPGLSLTSTLAACEDILHDRVLAACTGIAPERVSQLVPHTTVVLLRVHETHAEYLLLQDSILLAFDGRDVVKFKDPRQDELNETFYAEQDTFLGNGETFSGFGYNDSLDRMVDIERAVRNRAGGFWTFTGLRGAAEQAVTGEIAVSANSEFVLASDGAARYWGMLGRPQTDAFTQPLELLLNHVRKAEMADASGQQYPRTGAHDDMAMLRVTRNRPA